MKTSHKVAGMAIAAAAAGLFGSFATTTAFAGDTGKVACPNSSACKGHGACKTASSSCKGQNACKGQGVTMQDSKAACEAAQKAAQSES